MKSRRQLIAEELTDAVAHDQIQIAVLVDIADNRDRTLNKGELVRPSDLRYSPGAVPDPDYFYD